MKTTVRVSNEIVDNGECFVITVITAKKSRCVSVTHEKYDCFKQCLTVIETITVLSKQIELLTINCNFTDWQHEMLARDCTKVVAR